MYKYIRAAKSDVVESGKVGGGTVEYTLYSDGKLVLDGYGEITSRPRQWMRHSEDVKSLVIASPNVQVGDSFNDSNIESLTMHSAGPELKKWAFNYCEHLKNVVLPYDIEQIPEYAFYRCTSLEYIEIPQKVKIIGGSAFSGCEHLSRIKLPSGLTKIDDYAFSSSSLKNISVPSTVKEIGTYAFGACKYLESVTFEGDVEQIQIGNRAFEGTLVAEEMRKYYKKPVAERSASWKHVKDMLEDDVADTIDPLYEQTEAGTIINELCEDVEDTMGVYLETSIQLGEGGIWVYSSNDDTCLAEDIDYASFNKSIINLALNAKSATAFKKEYKAFLTRSIADHEA